MCGGGKPAIVILFNKISVQQKTQNMYLSEMLIEFEYKNDFLFIKALNFSNINQYMKNNN